MVELPILGSGLDTPRRNLGSQRSESLNFEPKRRVFLVANKLGRHWLSFQLWDLDHRYKFGPRHTSQKSWILAWEAVRKSVGCLCSAVGVPQQGC